MCSLHFGSYSPNMNLTEAFCIFVVCSAEYLLVIGKLQIYNNLVENAHMNVLDGSLRIEIVWMQYDSGF